MKESCIFCSRDKFKSYNYPSSHFNNKLFKYNQCEHCNLVQLNPLPNEDDYKKMYTPDYQNNEIDKQLVANIDEPLNGLRFSYKKQFDYIKKHFDNNVSILDYGCGNGNFIYNTSKNGFSNVSGAEFNPNYVSLLSKEIPECNFYLINDVLNNNINVKFDVIRLSNVLEHLTNPIEVITKLKSKLNKGGLLLVEGPIEANFYPMNAINRLYFNTIGKGKTSTMSPYHIFFSNYKNQREFFQNLNFEELDYYVREINWPYSKKIEIKNGLKNFLTSVFSMISRTISNNLSSKWGNTFIYLGRNND